MFEDVVSGHKFNIGQTVNYIPQFGAGASKSAYTITQLLPLQTATSNIG